ncbi:MAG TPA: serine/threonine-protein kinase [Vicinamibacteria bacterium]|nr:serine/threonine-protein kinase [Vicinamibacteria bacterium]
MNEGGSLEPPTLAEEALRSLCLSDTVFRERYEGWQLAGQGAFASVVLSRFLGQPVALKIFTHLTEEGRTRFRTEFASAVRVTSPYAVRTYSAFERGGLCWIEMEAVEGTTLKDELDRREKDRNPFQKRDALEIAQAVARVLAEAHAAGIVHRDIKPANILLPHSRNPVAKLGDFGIARIVGAAKLTATGAFPGTPQFGAPEAFAGRSVGPPGDIYSFSLCLFALFTNNRFPWILDEDAALETLIMVHVKKSPRSMRSFEPTLPEALDDLVLGGLEKRPQRRPTAAAFVERLGRMSAEGPRPLEPNPRSRSALRSYRGALLAGGLLLGGVLLYGARVGPVGRRRTSPPISESAGASALLPPAKTPAEPKPAPLQVSLGRNFVHITNGSHRLGDVRVTLVSQGGAESAFAFSGELGPEEVADIALQGFSPPPGSAVQEVLVRAKEDGKEPVEVRLVPPSVPVPRPPTQGM